MLAHLALLFEAMCNNEQESKDRGIKVRIRMSMITLYYLGRSLRGICLMLFEKLACQKHRVAYDFVRS